MADSTPKRDVVITFHTTTDAMAVQGAVNSGVCALAGRMIPVPRELSAGCGLSWLVEDGERGEVLAVLDRFGLEYECVVSMSDL